MFPIPYSSGHFDQPRVAVSVPDCAGLVSIPLFIGALRSTRDLRAGHRPIITSVSILFHRGTSVNQQRNGYPSLITLGRFNPYSSGHFDQLGRPSGSRRRDCRSFNPLFIGALRSTSFQIASRIDADKKVSIPYSSGHFDQHGRRGGIEKGDMLVSIPYSSGALRSTQGIGIGNYLSDSFNPLFIGALRSTSPTPGGGGPTCSTVSIPKSSRHFDQRHLGSTSLREIYLQVSIPYSSGHLDPTKTS